MINKLLTFLVACFLIYALINKSTNLWPKFQELPKEQKSELMTKLKNYVEILTADPSNSSLNGKQTPIISQNTEIVNNDASPQTYDPNKDAPILQNKTTSEAQRLSKPKLDKNNNIDATQNKIYNFLYNVLHTEKGQELLNKILFTPNNADKNSSGSGKLNPYHNNSILNVIDGEGAAVRCGDNVTVKYTTRLVSGQVIENASNPKTFQVGNGDVIKGVEYAVIGMKKGGIRRLIVPPRLAYLEEKFSKNLVAENEFITIDIELVELKVSPVDDSQLKIFSDASNDDAYIIPCSNPVYFSYKIYDATEKELVTSVDPVSFVLGSKSVPDIINRIFDNIMSHSKRVVMFPSSLLYNKKINFLPPQTKLPEKQMLILEINTGYKVNKENNLNSPRS